MSLSRVSLWPHGLYNAWNSPGQNTGVGSLSLLHGIFLTQESNQGLLHCTWILYQLRYQGSPSFFHIKSSKWSSLVSSPRSNFSLEATNPGIIHGSQQRPFSMLQFYVRFYWNIKRKLKGKKHSNRVRTYSLIADYMAGCKKSEIHDTYGYFDLNRWVDCSVKLLFLLSHFVNETH